MAPSQITPEEAQAIRPDALVAISHPNDPNEANYVLGFPYLFRGTLDIRARAIDDVMKFACAEALAALAREDVPDEAAMAYGRNLSFGPDSIFPAHFDPRPIHRIPPVVASAGMRCGTARKPLEEVEAYSERLCSRMDPTASVLRGIHARARAAQAAIVFAEEDDSRVLRANVNYQCGEFGRALVFGREGNVREKLTVERLADAVDGLEVVNADNTPHLEGYKAILYKRLQRRGFDQEDIQRLAARDRHVFAALTPPRLVGPANVLVMPARHSASISVKLMQEMAGAKVTGPILAGVDKPIQLCSTVSTANDILDMAMMAAAQMERQESLL